MLAAVKTDHITYDLHRHQRTTSSRIRHAARPGLSSGVFICTMTPWCTIDPVTSALNVLPKISRVAGTMVQYGAWCMSWCTLCDNPMLFSGSWIAHVQ